jgi:hypothetical protein
VSDAPLATTVTRDIADPIRSRAGGSMLAMRLRANSEYTAIPLLALAIAAGLFALFLTAIKSPVDFVSCVWRGGFGNGDFVPEYAATLGAPDSDRARGGDFRRASA